MIVGIGTDIVEIERVRNAAARWGERFLRRVFTDKEIAYCFGKKDPHPHLAARFAAKEALIKAVGRAVPFADIEVRNEPSGKPVLSFSGPAPESSGTQSTGVAADVIAHLTLSHERQYAVATVVLERKNNGKV